MIARLVAAIGVALWIGTTAYAAPQATTHCDGLLTPEVFEVRAIGPVHVYATREASLAARRAADAIAARYPEFSRIFGEPEEALTICIAPSRHDFRFDGEPRADDVAGASFTTRRSAVVAADNDEVGRIALHETAHLMAGVREERGSERPLPPWLSEGIAEVASRTREEISERGHRALASGDLQGLRSLEAADPRRLAPAEKQAFYDSATVTTLTLIESEGWDGVWSMLMITGKIPADLEAKTIASLAATSP